MSVRDERIQLGLGAMKELVERRFAETLVGRDVRKPHLGLVPRGVQAAFQDETGAEPMLDLRSHAPVGTRGKIVGCQALPRMLDEGRVLLILQRQSAVHPQVRRRREPRSQKTGDGVVGESGSGQSRDARGEVVSVGAVAVGRETKSRVLSADFRVGREAGRAMRLEAR